MSGLVAFRDGSGCIVDRCKIQIRVYTFLEYNESFKPQARGKEIND